MPQLGFEIIILVNSVYDNIAKKKSSQDNFLLIIVHGI